jgi:DNA-binding transcriptional ArsR family regulator
MVKSFTICPMRPYKHPTADQFTLERIFHALSDPARMEIVRHLARVEAATCGELDGGRPKSSMSHHFRILRDAGLVHTRAAGTIHQNTLRATELNARFPGLLKAILAQVPDGSTVTAERKR